MSIKVKDIAQMLNISPSTVSLVLNDKPGISEATKQRVFGLICELGCEDMLPKKKDAVKSNKSIGFLIYKKSGRIITDTQFFSELIQGIDIRCRSYGYKLMVTYINEAEDPEEHIKTFTRDDCKGIIILATEMDAGDFACFKEIEPPCVVLDSYFERLNYDCIVINNVQGAFEATDYLAGMGHKKIGYLSSSYRINNFRERYEGFSKALRNNDITENRDYVLELGSLIDNSYSAMKERLENGSPLPTAYFAENDLVALGAIKALQEFGHRVPEDVSVMGFDNIPLSSILEPHLSTIHVPKQRLGMLAVDRLVSRLTEACEEFVKIEVGTTLIERQSVKRL